MTVQKAAATVVAFALLFAVLGGGIGYGLCVLVPGYYRGLFEERSPYLAPGAPSQQIDPVQMGLGLGVTQGFVGGIVVGLVVVFLLTRGARSL